MMAFLIRYLAALAPMHEFNLDTLACGAGPLAVRVRFIRNEALALSGKGTTAAKRVVFALTTARARSFRRTPEAAPPSPPVLPPTPPAPPLPRPYLMCEWAEAAAEADLMVLNRGMHFVPDGLITQQLHATFSTLHALRRAARTELVHVHEVVYRSTHASIPSCHLASKIHCRGPFLQTFASRGSVRFGPLNTSINTKVASSTRPSEYFGRAPKHRTNTNNDTCVVLCGL